MDVKPNRSVYDYVRQIENSLRASQRHGQKGPKDYGARMARFRYWERLARKVGIPDETIDQVRKVIETG